MVFNNFIGRFSILLACDFTLDLLFSACPTGIESCYEDYDFMFYDIYPHPVIDPAVSDMQSCAEHCKSVPGCIAGSWGTYVVPPVCYCKWALNGVGGYAKNITLFTFANNTAVRTHCDDTTPSCQSLGRMKTYFILEDTSVIHCEDSANGDQIHFGDFDGDDICDATCWNENSGTTKWAKGANTLMFVKPPNTATDGSVGSFCRPNSTLGVKDVNGDSKDDLICTYPDNHQVAMLSDDAGLNPLLLISYANCQNTPNDCLFLDSPSSCAACATTGSIQNGIYTKTGQHEFVVKCQDGYEYRGKSAPLGLCNRKATSVSLRDGMCIKQTAVNVMDQYSNKRINLDAVAMHKTNTAIECGWLCLDDMRCGALQFKHGAGSCELFSTFEVQSILEDDPGYEVMMFKNN